MSGGDDESGDVAHRFQFSARADDDQALDDDIERLMDGGGNPRPPLRRQRGGGDDATGAGEAPDTGPWTSVGIDADGIEDGFREAGDEMLETEEQIREEWGVEAPAALCVGCRTVANATEAALVAERLRAVFEMVSENIGKRNHVALFLEAARLFRKRTAVRTRPEALRTPTTRRGGSSAAGTPTEQQLSTSTAALRLDDADQLPLPQWNAATMYAHYRRHTHNSQLEQLWHTVDLKAIERTIMTQSICQRRKRGDGQPDEVVVNKEQLAALLATKKLRLAIDSKKRDDVAKNTFSGTDAGAMINTRATGRTASTSWMYSAVTGRVTGR